MRDKVKVGIDHRTQIIVAVIGLVGVLGAATIVNLPQLLEVFGVSAPQRYEAGGHRGQPGSGGGGRGAPVAGDRSPGAADQPRIRPSVAPPPRFEPQNPFTLRAVINDPDGYMNVRSRGSGSGAIIDRMVADEAFYTYIQEGRWWRVRTPRGKVGYMHVSRIRLLPPGSGSPE